MTILEKIDRLRNERGWSVNNLAMEAMLTQSTLNNLYSRNAEPKISTLRAICNAFGITLSEFFSDDRLESHSTNSDEELKTLWPKLSEAQKKAVISLLRTMA